MPSPDPSSQSPNPADDGGSKIVDRGISLSARAAAVFPFFQLNGRLKEGKSFVQAWEDVRKNAFRPGKISLFAIGEVAAKMPVGTADFLENRFVGIGMRREHAKPLSVVAAAVGTSLLEGVAAFSLVGRKDGIKPNRVVLPSVAAWALARDMCGALVLAKASKKDESKKNLTERLMHTGAAAGIASAVSLPLDVMHHRKGMSADRVPLPELGRLARKLFIPRIAQGTVGALLFVGTQAGLEFLRKPRTEPPSQESPSSGGAGVLKQVDQASQKPSSQNPALSPRRMPSTRANTTMRASQPHIAQMGR